MTFAELLREINKIEGLERIRFMTSHPKDLSDDLIRVMGKCSKVCNHLHLPLQSGSSRILKEMNRRYTKEQYLDLVERIRRAVPDISLTTDIIVGFPGETDEDFEETMDVVQQVLCGRVNKNLVATLNRLGGRALGLCGLDGALFQARLLDERFGLVGEITKVDPTPVNDALDNNYIPVVSTVALGTDAETSYNINADTAAAKLAVALGAEKLILLTDVRGLLRDPKDERTLIPELQLSQVPALVREGVISGGMIPKVDCCVEAVRSGVKSAIILDGRVPHSILIELLSNEGIGTMLVN